ncbi:BTAD domain-containing putative transcriptional regulator [Amycolatopsis alba]|uniref:BTAD domain-containing putative transcriptional regulator n=1 Tax=Amycolatopsis alba TaxID=76020 RepID=UPI0003A60C0F|nr:BTAD domain-containing putative transcriptional regulator [Amycolatopsis alba]
MEFAILGPLEIVAAETRVRLGGPREERLLAALLLNPNRVVPVDRLVDAVWDEQPPATAAKQIRNLAAGVRRRLAEARCASAVETDGPGYRLRVAADQLDADLFTARVAQARRDTDPRSAALLLRRALALWRGPVLDGLPGRRPAAGPFDLNEQRLTAWEECIDHELRLGRHRELVAELSALTEAHPLRDRFTAQLMLALHGSGRSADGLAVYRRHSAALAEGLGLNPGTLLVETQQRLLRDEPAPRPGPAATGETVPPQSIPGREDVLAAVDTALRAAGAGRGGLLLAVGEPGIGKTRVAQAAAGRAAELGLAVAVGRCPDSEGVPDLWPWMTVLRTLDGEADPPPDRAGVPGSRVHAAIVTALVAVAGRRPLLVVLEDLHWADRDSLTVLHLLATVLPELPLVVLGTSRDDTLPAVAGTRLPLRRLTETEVSTLAEHELGAPVDPAVARLLHTRSGGNPFHAVELARLAREIEPVDLATALPDGARELIMRRVRQLPGDARSALLIAAALGEEFEVDLVAEVSHTPRDALLDMLEAGLRHRLLTETGVANRYRFDHALIRDALRHSVSRLRLAGVHADIATALDRRAGTGGDPDLLDARAFHWLAAAPTGHAERAVEAGLAAAERAGHVSAHPNQARLLSGVVDVIDNYVPPRNAEDTARLREVLVRLGRASCRSGLQDQATTALRRAIRLAERSGDPAALAAAAGVHAAEAIGSTREYGVCDTDTFQALQAAARRLPSDDTPVRSLCLAALAVEGYFAPDSDPRELSRISAEAVSMARRLDDQGLLIRTLHMRYNAIRRPDTLPDRLRIANELVELSAKPGCAPEWAPIALLRRAHSVLENGDIAAAQRDIDACRKANEQVLLPEVDVHLRWWSAMRTGLTGDTDAAERLSHEAFLAHRRTVWGAEPAYAAQVASWLLDRRGYRELEAVIRAKHRPGSPITSAHLGLALALQGNLAEARAHCQPAKETPEPPQDWLWLLQMVLRAYTWALCGDTASCRYALERLLPYSGRAVTNGSGILCWGSIDHFLGEVAAGAGEHEQAVSLFRQAADHNADLQATHWRDRSVRRLAELDSARSA